MLPGSMSHASFERKRYPKTSDHGTLRTDYTGTPATIVGRASVQPGNGLGTQLDPVNRDGAEIAFAMFAALSYDIAHDDIIHLRGKDYQVSGEPERWDVGGSLSHQVVKLSKWVS